jgi:hypothetical protein
MKSFASDVRQAVRSLRASPGLMATSVLSLGLGLGVNLTLFTAIEAVFFYEPTVADRDRVVAVHRGSAILVSVSRPARQLGVRVGRRVSPRALTASVRRRRKALRRRGLPNFEFLGVPALGALQRDRGRAGASAVAFSATRSGIGDSAEVRMSSVER